MRTSGEMRGFLAVPRPIVGAGLPRPDLGGWWPSRLVATAAADCLSSKSPLGARRRAAQQHNMIRRIDLAERSRPPLALAALQIAVLQAVIRQELLN